MPAVDLAVTPFLVEISGAGFSHSAVFASLDDAYSRAWAIRDTAQAGRLVLFTDRFGHDGRYRVLGIAILRWNPLTGHLLAHARSWQLNDPDAEALTALPDLWYDEPLPADWRAGITGGHLAAAQDPPARRAARGEEGAS
ncbi:hypothetical protein [Streptomyces graminilatus]|uniref:hypothetical protein n=1 Tax=Streptomyces graminilatus TaxID=1464070 RepID=UPI0006E23E74|nr:hypothetical protein [Streptomyces graminilatus]